MSNGSENGTGHQERKTLESENGEPNYLSVADSKLKPVIGNGYVATQAIRVTGAMQVDKFIDPETDVEKTELTPHCHHDHVKSSNHTDDESKFPYGKLNKVPTASDKEKDDSEFHERQRSRTANDDGDYGDLHHHHHHHDRQVSTQRSRTSTILSLFSFTRRESVTLPRRLGLGSAVALLIGIMIGTGIFVSPRGVLEQSGSFGASLVIWAMCGVIAMLGALVFAELALMFPKSGGDHTYLQETYGELLAFLHGWGAMLIVRPTGLAIVSLVLGEYMVYPHFQRSLHCMSGDQRAVKLYAATFIIFLVSIHASGLKMISKLQIVLTGIKIALLLIIIITGMVKIYQGYTNYLNPNSSFQGSTRDAFAYGIAFYQGMFAYEGWNTLNYAIEEMKDPYKTFPRAVFIAIPVVTILYVLTNVAYYTVLSPEQVLQSDAIAVTFATSTMGSFDVVVPYLVICSAFGSANGLCYSLSRMTVVLGREGHMPQVMSMVHSGSVSPILALLTMACISLIMLTLPIDLDHMIEYFSFAVWLSYSLIFLSHVILRIKKPELPRPFRIHWCFSIFLCLVSLFFMIAPFFESYTTETVAVVAILLSGVVFYFPFVRWKYYPPFMDKVTIFCQLFLNIVGTKYQTPEEHAEEVLRQEASDMGQSE